ncbi:butyrophilin-like protein 2 [Symphorus nematophorus]
MFADVQVNPGEDVCLQCRGPTDASIRLIGWTRTDLKTEKFVFFYRDEKPNENFQLPSFRGRVELREPEMKDGDASVILKNVTVNDTGTYECWLILNEGDKPELVSAIKLAVQDGRNLHKHFGLFAVLLLAVIVAGFVLWTRQRSMKKNSEQPAADEADQLEKLPIHVVDGSFSSASAMLPDTTLVLLLLLICAAHFCVSEVPEEQQRRTAKPADDVALQCCGPTDAPNLLIAWKRPDLKTDKFVFFFRDNGSSITNQHPSFRGRVELIDPEMKDGNVSVILKNVTVNDTGTYECWIGAERTRQEERLDPEVFSTTQLKVDDPELLQGIIA